jgi:hypothetical protein
MLRLAVALLLASAMNAMAQTSASMQNAAAAPEQNARLKEAGQLELLGSPEWL